ncbi:MAG: c-type cytochrome [Verrucomicrobiae bacterium]|nr:c-type cytochrome [Verrucomicrobiae bacterium]
MRKLIVVLLALAFTQHISFAQNGDKGGEEQVAPIPADKIPPAPPLPPGQALKTFKLPPDFEIQLVASEPLIDNPVIVQWDNAGRLWVMEMRSFMQTPNGAGELEPVSQVSILHDTDGDGRMDKKTVFLDKLLMPRAMAFTGDGVLICEPPGLYYYPILPGDKPGKRITVDPDYAPAAVVKNGVMNVEHAANGFIRAIDNWHYNAKSTFRYSLQQGEWKKEPTYFKGQWGISQDNYGRLAFNSNSDHFRMEPTPSEYLLRNPFYRDANYSIQPLPKQDVWPARINPGVNRAYRKGTLRPDGRLAKFTGASALAIYRGGHFPPEFIGDAFVPEPTGNLIRRDDVTESEGRLTAINPYARNDTEFLTSTDEIFRPVNAYMGPDGAMYFVDMYHGIIQHRIFLTSYLRKQAESRGLDKVVDYGRIYRVVHRGRPLDQGPNLARASPEELVAALANNNGWYRDNAQRILVEKAPAAAIEPLKKLATNGANHLGRLHALWTLSGLGFADLEILGKVLQTEKHPKVVASAIRLCEPILKTWEQEDALKLVVAKATSKDADIKLQVALTLSGVDSPLATKTLTKLARDNAGSIAIRDAIISGLPGREYDFIAALLADKAFSKTSKDREKLLGELARCVIIQGRRDPVNNLLTLIGNDATLDWQKTALIVGMTPAKIKSTKGLPPVKAKTIRLTEEPTAFAALKGIKNKTVATALSKLDEVLVWPGKPGVKPEPPVRPLNDEERVLFESGKQLYGMTCGACHQDHGFGMAGMAPPLADSEWVASSEDRLIRIVLQGIGGPITVLGQKFDMDMPGHGTFSDEQIASVLTYIRREWDHTHDPVSSGKVAAVRKATSSREEAWTAEELLKLK